MKDPMKLVSKKDRQRLLNRERKFRATGDWGHWETMPVFPGSAGNGGWASHVTQRYRNRVFAVLQRNAEAGVIHLAISSLSGIRPTWWEMQRIKDELAGEDTTGIEVYPPKADVVDGADMFHLWVLRGKLPFGLHIHPNLPGMRASVSEADEPRHQITDKEIQA